MPELKQEIKAALYRIFFTEGLVTPNYPEGESIDYSPCIEGDYDGTTGHLTFNFTSHPSQTTTFKYNSANPTRDLQTFQELLMEAGGVLIRQKNAPADSAEQQAFIDSVTE